MDEDYYDEEDDMYDEDEDREDEDYDDGYGGQDDEGDDEGDDEEDVGERSQPIEEIDRHPDRTNWYTCSFSLQFLIRRYERDVAKLNKLFKGALETYRGQSDFKDSFMDTDVLKAANDVVFSRVPSELPLSAIISPLTFFCDMYNENEVSDWFEASFANAAFDAIERCPVNDENFTVILSAMKLVSKAGSSYIALIASRSQLVNLLELCASDFTCGANCHAAMRIISSFTQVPSIPAIRIKKYIQFLTNYLHRLREVAVSQRNGTQQGSSDSNPFISEKDLLTYVDSAVNGCANALETEALKWYSVQQTTLIDDSLYFLMERLTPPRKPFVNTICYLFSALATPVEDKKNANNDFTAIKMTICDKLVEAGVLTALVDVFMTSVDPQASDYYNKDLLCGVLALVIFSNYRMKCHEILFSNGEFINKLMQACRDSVPDENEDDAARRARRFGFNQHSTATPAGVLLKRFLPSLLEFSSSASEQAATATAVAYSSSDKARILRAIEERANENLLAPGARRPFALGGETALKPWMFLSGYF